MAVTTLDLGPYPAEEGHSDAVALDQRDPLSEFADRFAPVEPGLIYLDGNSLGRLPKATIARVRDVVEDEWGQQLIRSWPARWWNQAAELGNRIAPLVGAGNDQVVVTDSTSVALFKLTLGAIRSRPGRRRVITDDLNFPTDNYVTAAAADLVDDCEVIMVRSEDGVHGPADAIIAALDEDTALLTLSHVAFKSGYMYDMERLTAAAHDVGAIVLWDLSHSVGAIPIQLAASGADLAVGCTYKYLNGGPGSPAFLYVNPSSSVENPLQGWWGHAEPFAFDLEYRSAASIRRFQTGTMPILSLAAVETGVGLSREAGVDRLRTKSMALSEFFIDRSADRLHPLGFELASPRSSQLRGSHVSLRHPDAWRVAQSMIEDGKLIPDFRAPNNIRFGLAPLYTSFVDVHTAIGRIERIVTSGNHESYPGARSSVT